MNIRHQLMHLAICILTALTLTACSGGDTTPILGGDLCEGVSCSERGSCFVRDSVPYCSCNAGYHPVGLACLANDEGDPCVDVTCSENGVCVDEEGLPVCQCSEGFAPDDSDLHCFPSDEPVVHEITDFAPGESVRVTGLSKELSDFLRTPEGTFLVATTGSSSAGEIEVARSDDGGDTWDPETFADGELRLYSGRLFMIDGDTVGLSGGEGGNWPFDGYLRHSDTDGASFSERWCDVSNMEDHGGERGISIIRTPADTFLALIPASGLRTRVSGTLDAWPIDTAMVLTRDSTGLAGLVAVDVVVHVVAPLGEDGFETHLSHDDGETFSLASTTETSRDIISMELFHDPEADTFYACGVSYDRTGEDVRVFTYRSDDGLTWGDERLHVSHLAIFDGSAVACHIDETGVYVAYQDKDTEAIMILLPGDPAQCGNDVREPGEACDGEDLDQSECLDFGFGGGLLRCDQCELDTEGCTEPLGPTRCVDHNSHIDGEYPIDPDGAGPYDSFSVYCHCMNPEEPGCEDGPREYLTLQDTFDDRNASFYVYNQPHLWAEVQYKKVRFADISILSIDGCDQTFGQPSGNPPQHATTCWGRAHACTDQEDPQGWMHIDLSGTPFMLDYDRMQWGPASGDSVWDVPPNDGIVVTGTGDGYCGGVLADPELLLTFTP